MKTKRVLPPRIFQIALLMIIGVHFIIPVYYIFHSPIRFIGLLPVAVGCWLNIYSDRLIKQHKTTIKPFEKPTAMIKNGPFRYSRNPIYLGMVLIVLGGSVISGAITSFLIPPVFAIVLHYKYILAEEKNMGEQFGEIYADYKARVRCWV